MPIDPPDRASLAHMANESNGLASTANPKTLAPIFSATAAAAVLVFSFLVSIYSVTYSGAFRVDDEHILMARAQSLALWGRLENPQVYGNDRVRALQELEQTSASQASSIEPAQAVIGAGLYRLGLWLEVGGAQTAFLLNIYATALTGVLVLLMSRSLGYGLGAATFAALLFGVGTMAWPYSKTFLRDPLAMLMVSVAYLGWILLHRWSERRRPIALILLVLGGVAAIMAKNTAWPHLIALGLAAGVEALLQRKWRRVRRGTVLVPISLVFAFVVVTVALPDEGALARYTDNYYATLAKHFMESLDLNLLIHTVGPFLSPSKSLFLFSPILILAPIGAVIAWQRLRWFVLPVILGTILLALAQAMFYRETWAGIFGWGLRFMLPALPLLSVMIAPIVARVSSANSRAGKLFVLSLIAVSVMIQLGGATVAWIAPYREWAERGLEPFSTRAAWAPEYLAIPIQLSKLFQTNSWDVAWVRVLQSDAQAVIIALSGIAIAFISAVYLRRLLRYGHSARARLVVAALGFAALAQLMGVGLPLLKPDPAVGGDRPELSEMTSWIHARLNRGDVVVVDSYGTGLWTFLMNNWSSHTPWYSLAFEIPELALRNGGENLLPSLPTVSLLTTLSQEYRRIWYLSSTEAPDDGLQREVNWLSKQSVLAAEKSFSGEAIARTHVFTIRLHSP